uniref:C2H2-type domain-containing protein n=1 Tax=Syphacia muris TaxID=451379 RepID=A0A0N5AAS1_9BILA
MILTSADQPNLLLKESINLCKMDFTQQQQALLIYQQQQAILNEYLRLLQILNLPSSSSFQSASFPTLQLPSEILQSPELLAPFIQQQQKAAALSQDLFKSKLGTAGYANNAFGKLDCGQTFVVPHEEHCSVSLTEQLEESKVVKRVIDKSEILRPKSSSYGFNKLISLPGTSQSSPKIQLLKSEASPLNSAVLSPASSDSKRRLVNKDKTVVDDEVVYVDVESVEDKNYAKGQRKAHIEFYRKLKALRQREKILECQLCHSKIENQEHSIRAHVHSHSDTALYRCKLCGAGSKEQSAMFSHTKRYHPTKMNFGFEDCRDMSSLSDILHKCFPRITPKSRVEYNEIVDRIWKKVETSSLTGVTCAICSNNVQAQRSSISRHVHCHPYYRCKHCKLMCAEQAEILCHFATAHKGTEPKIHKDYNVCATADVMVSVLKKCFPSFVKQ